jgi:FlaA1/EpsC-like NDP-sugar epimerase
MKLLLENWRKYLNESKVVIPGDIHEEVLAVFDFDETIADTHAKTVVRAKNSGKALRRLNQKQLDATAPKSGEEFDFSEFDDVDYAEEKKYITDKMKKFIDDPNAQVIVATARRERAQDSIQRYLNFLGIPTKSLIIQGLTGGSKGDYIQKIIEKNPSIKELYFFDDSEANVQDVWKKVNKFKEESRRELVIKAAQVKEDMAR